MQFMFNIACITLICFFAVNAETVDRTLQFKNNKFKICQFADLHYGEAENLWWGPQQDINSTRVMKNVLNAEKDVDLVVFSGDQITGNNIHTNATRYWEKVIQVALINQKKWVSLFGNHDDAKFESKKRSTTTRTELMEFDMSFELSLSQSRNFHGSISNYFLPIMSSNSTDQVSVPLYFFDSGGGRIPEIVWKDQVLYYQNVSNKLKKQFSIKNAITFLHIPLLEPKNESFNFKKKKKEYVNLYSSEKCVGMNKNGGVTPVKKEDVICVYLFILKISKVTKLLRIFQAFQKQKDVKAVFVGHDHGNDWCCPFETFQLCYGRHTGYGGYGKWKRGARIIEITENPFKIKTWVRMENGDIIHSESFD